MTSYAVIQKDLISQLTDEQLVKCLANSRLSGRTMIGTFGSSFKGGVVLAEFKELLEEMSRRLKRRREAGQEHEMPVL